jgi:GntR family transcriptional repressor for pyruvate dehydrogenase complex
MEVRLDKNLLKPVKKTRLYEEIVRQIKSLIIQGKLKPSDKLPSERELAGMFHVGRPTIREAIRALAQMGIIEVNGGQKGTIVNKSAFDPSMESVKEQLGWMIETKRVSIQHLTEFRDAFERRLALLASERVTKKQLKEIATLLGEMEASTGDVSAYLEKAIEFHKAMARSTQNPVFYMIWSAFSDFILAHYKKVLEIINKDIVRQLYLTNAETYKAILSEDQARICSAVDENIKLNREISAFKIHKGRTL